MQSRGQKKRQERRSLSHVEGKKNTMCKGGGTHVTTETKGGQSSVNEGDSTCNWARNPAAEYD